MISAAAGVFSGVLRLFAGPRTNKKRRNPKVRRFPIETESCA